MASTYIKDEQGGTFIAPSQRPDGTWRKPRRVKDGYIPQEEVPLYESKGKQFIKNKPQYPVGASPEYIAELKAKQEAAAAKAKIIPGLVKVEAKKKKKKSKSKNVESITQGVGNVSISEAVANKNSSKNEKPQSESKSTGNNENETGGEKPDTSASESQLDPQKRLKSLRKKLRQIEAFKEKMKEGQLKNPDKEILDKMARKKEIEKEIKLLEESNN